MSEVMSSSDIEDVLSSIRRLVTGDLRPRGAAAAVAANPEAEDPGESDTDDMAKPPAGRLLLTPALRVVHPAGDSAPAAAARPPIDGLLSLIGARVAPSGFEAETGDAFEAAAEAAPPRPTAAAPATTPPFAVAEVGVAEVAVPAAPMAPQPQVEEEAEVDRLPDAAASIPAETPDDVGADDRGPVVDLDEDTLRELIRDVLREELQGPMGERITRNIRKLVRAELARAASLRQID